MSAQNPAAYLEKRNSEWFVLCLIDRLSGSLMYFKTPVVEIGEVGKPTRNFLMGRHVP